MSKIYDATYQIRGTNEYKTLKEICSMISSDTVEEHTYVFTYKTYECTILGMSPFKINIDDAEKICVSWHCAHIDFGSDSKYFDAVVNQIEQKVNIEFTSAYGIDFAHLNDLVLCPIYKNPGDDITMAISPIISHINICLTYATPRYIKSKLKQIIDVLIDITDIGKVIIIQKHFRGMLGRRRACDLKHLKYKPGGMGYNSARQEYHQIATKKN